MKESELFRILMDEYDDDNVKSIQLYIIAGLGGFISFNDSMNGFIYFAKKFLEGRK